MHLIRYFVFLCGIVLLCPNAFSARIKDITTIAGIRDNQLIGYGLIVGLDGTGDRINAAPFTDQTFKNMLLEFGIRLPFNRTSQLKNVAAVAISAKLPAFARIGQTIDITVLSLGNATSLRGGSLLMTPLKGADGKVYGMAQGNIIVSGFGAQGADGSKVTVNVTSSGTIPNGATVEQTIDTPFIQNGEIIFELMRPDFTTALRIERAINKDFGYKVASAMDARIIAVNFHSAKYKDGGSAGLDEVNERRKYVPIISRIENIRLRPAEIGARIIVNARTGTIVIGHNVTISPVAVSHGNLSVIVTERPYVSQPNAFAGGRTVKGSASDININQSNRAFLLAPGPSLQDLVDSINRVGAAPGDLISILEAMKAAGALDADLEVI
jgi:flagellar P-ring protein precursor FlgI